MKYDPRRLLVHAVLKRQVRKGASVSVAESVAQRRADPPSAAPPSGLARRGVTVTTTEHEGMTIYRVGPARRIPGVEAVYLHGGAYVGEILPIQWSFVLGLVRTTGMTCTVPVYRLAPDETAERTVARVAEVIAATIDGSVERDVVVLGDSAGGGLAVAATASLRDAGRPVPDRLILLSPWLDVTMSDPVQAQVERHDLMLDRSDLAECGRLYAGDLPPDDARVSPLHGDLAGLPELHVFTGSHDVLVTDSRRLAERARAEGVEVTYVEAAEMQHVYALFPLLPESIAARHRIRALLR